MRIEDLEADTAAHLERKRAAEARMQDDALDAALTSALVELGCVKPEKVLRTCRDQFRLEEGVLRPADPKEVDARLVLQKVRAEVPELFREASPRPEEGRPPRDKYAGWHEQISRIR